MTNEEADEYRESLVSLLQQHQVGWIVEQSNEAMTLGKTVSKRVAQQSPSFELEPTRRGSARRSAEFRATQPFDATEKLVILLDAIERALVSPSRMEAEMLKNLDSGVVNIQFFREDNSQPDFTVSPNRLTETTRLAEDLKHSVDSIRGLL